MASNDQFSNLWIIKGNKDNILIDDRDGDIIDHIHECLSQKKKSSQKDVSNWWIQRRKKLLPTFCPKQGSQIVLAWRSRKNIGIVGIGKLTRVCPYGILEVDEYDAEPNEHWFNWEPVQCFCEKCNKENKQYKYISMARIKSIFSDEMASGDTPIFIQPSVIQTVYPVSDIQASRLLGLIEQSVELNLKSKRLLSALGAPRPRHSALAERNA